MQPRAAVLFFSSNKNCFLNIPQSWSSSLSLDQVVVFEIQNEQRTVFASWSGGTTTARHDSGLEVIEINGLYASKLGFQHAQEVLVSSISSVSDCSQLHVEPVSVDDWEILELHSSYIEGNLLNQLRVVWPGQVFPVWVQKSVCIFVKISSIDPNARCCLLQNRTEVIVAPKLRGSRPANQQAAHKRSDLNGPIKDQQDSKQTNGDGGDDDTAGTVKEVNSHKEEGVMRKAFGYISSWWRGQPTDSASLESSQDLSSDQRPLLSRKENIDEDINLVLRVQDLDYVQKMEHSLDSTDREATRCVDLSDQSSTVYVHSHTLLNKYPALQDKIPMFDSFLAVLSKLSSPSERESKLKKAMEKTAQRRTRGEKHGIETTPDDLLEDSETDNPKVVVRVVVLDGSKHHRLIHQGHVIGEMQFDRPNVMLKDHLMIPEPLRRQLGLDVTGRVQLSGVMWPECGLLTIKLHPLFEKPEHFTEDMMRIAFSVSLQGAASKLLPVVVSQGLVVRSLIKQDLEGEFLLTLTTDSAGKPGHASYCLLHSDMLDKVKVQVSGQLTPGSKPREVPVLPFWTTQQLDLPLPKVTLKQLGGVSAVSGEILDHIHSCLGVSPLTSQLFSGSPGLHNGGVLLCGGKGSGKTALASATCRKLAELPWLAHVAVVECKQLRGKRVESIRKLLERTFNEAAWRQPSVVLLDDLDHVTAAPSGPEQEMSGEALYYGRVAEVIKDLLKLEMREGSHIAVIATSRSRSSVHQSLVTSHGNHFFQKIVTLKPPDKTDRPAILKAILTNKTSVATTCINDLDLQAVTSKTEGYVPRDLEMVVDRAIHAHLMMNPVVGDNTEELFLTDQDFTVALDGFSPASLRNVSLHKAGETGWEDVGGLHSIRKTLVETLQWPSKYPELFANCPLRLRSGLLLYGAPGTGKTLLAGVVAKECSLNFISIKGPELLSKYIGASEQAVRDTFIRAQSAKPCILFFDEFDSLAPRRGHDSTGVTDRVVNQLLTQLDGVEGLEGVYVLAATSRPDLIDPALLRPGRLDKALHCGLPTQDERLEILQALTRKMTLSPDVDLETLATQCEHFTGADFKALLYNAQLESIHEATGFITTSRDAELTETNDEVAIAEENSSKDLSEKVPPGEPGEVAMVTEKQPVVMPTSPTAERESGVIYIPNLEEGATDFDQQDEEKILAEIAHLEPVAKHSDNSHSPRTDKAAKKVIQIKQRHLVNALADMGPSVSESERLRYQMIYETFVASRGGNFSDGIKSAGKKATLA